MSGKIVTDKERCTLHGKCGAYCYAEDREISGRYCSVEEVYRIAAKDIDFYEHTGGGVTLSDGEALVYAEFAAVLLKNLKRRAYILQ